MKHHFIDRYSKQNTVISRIPIQLKLIILILILFAIIIIPNSFILYCFFPLIIIFILSKVPVKFILLRILIISPFILIIGLLEYISGTRNLSDFFYTIFKSISSIGFVLLFSVTTKFPEFINLLKKNKIPGIFIHLLNFLYRYFFILANEYERMQKGFVMKKKRQFFLYNLKIYFIMAGLLFIRSYERSERIFQAMLMKGYKL